MPLLHHSELHQHDDPLPCDDQAATSEEGSAPPDVDRPRVTQQPEPLSPSYRNRVRELSHTYRSHEQDDADVVTRLLTDNDTLEDLVDALDLAIDLRRADSDASRVECRVGSTVDEVPAMSRRSREVALMPNPGAHGALRLASRNARNT